jgi:hypothetical protein
MGGSVTDACIDAGATSINGMSFGLSDPGAARVQAITKAIAYSDIPNAVQPTFPVIARVSAGVGVPTNLDQSNVSESASVRVVFLAEP